MHFSVQALAYALLALSPTFTAAASSWGFEDGSVSVQGKKTSAGAGLKEKLVQNTPLSKPVSLGPSDSLKIILTTKEGSTAKRPHQTFLNLKDTKKELETSFALQLKENGKGKLELTQKDIPIALLSSAEPLSASLMIASFGSSKPYNSPVFDLTIAQDPASPLPSQENPVRYGKLEEIHHIFKSDPTSPPLIITLVFTAAVVATVPALLIAWVSLGANLNHLSKAITDAPIPHSVFFFSIIAIEGIFFLYYTTWNLFQTLPAAMGVGLIAFLSGSRALREVQGRRLAGLR